VVEEVRLEQANGIRVRLDRSAALIAGDQEAAEGLGKSPNRVDVKWLDVSVKRLDRYGDFPRKTSGVIG
jgi:hypothetical protein